MSARGVGRPVAMHKLQRPALVLAAGAMAGMAPHIASYPALYVLLLVYLFSAIRVIRELASRMFVGTIAFYCAFALLNISEYRNYISVEALSVYVISLVTLVAPIAFTDRAHAISAPERRLTRFAKLMIAGHLTIAWVAVAYVYATKGLVIVNQDARFGISTAVGYTIRSTLFVPVFVLMCSNRPAQRSLFLLVVVLSLLPALLIASRSTVMLAILAVALYYFVAQRRGWDFAVQRLGRARKQKVALGLTAALACYVVVAGGFYVRRANTDQLMSGSEYVQTYLGQYPKILMMAIAPLQQGLNETSALTSRIVDSNIVNYDTATPLLFADFDNLLGRSDVSAAQYFGNTIGRAQDGGLTPGLVGGVLLDYRHSYVLVFLLLGLGVVALRYAARNDRAWLVVYLIMLTQVIHLFHRGFIKPEYVSTLIISLVYVWATAEKPAHQRVE